MSTVNRSWYDGMLTTEDWWAVWLGLILFGLSLLSIASVDAVGWMANVKTWVLGQFEWSKVLVPAGKGYKEMSPFASWGVTYVVFTGITCTAAYFMKFNVRKFFLGWTVLFVLLYAIQIVGNEAHLAATRDTWKKYGITAGLSLTGEGSYILALIVGLIIGNFFKGFAEFLKEAAKPEWFIKTGIVLLGIKLGLTSMQAAGFAFEIMIAGAAAAFVAYMLFWPIVYTMGRKLFGLSRPAAAVLSSGISICGVSASIATAGAIRAKPALPVMVSTLVVIFATFELIILPGFYTWVAPDQPIVNGAAMGMTVKTDGADAAAGAVLEVLMRTRAAADGINWQEGWILTSSIATKIWIDVFIGVWAFVLAMIWVYKVERKPGQSTVAASEIWFRFPKFVLGYLFTWLFVLWLGLSMPEVAKSAKGAFDIAAGPMRGLMFGLTFLAIGVITDFSKLKGLGRLALLYAIALVGVIAPIAYLVAWIFHNGMMPPLVIPAAAG